MISFDEGVLDTKLRTWRTSVLHAASRGDLSGVDVREVAVVFMLGRADVKMKSTDGELLASDADRARKTFSPVWHPAILRS